MKADTLKIYRCHPDAIVPVQHSAEAVGYDLCSIEDFKLFPGDRIVVRTGLVVQPPSGYHTEILLRSSMAYKYNIMLINGVGLIDRDYSGPEDELRIMLYRAPSVSFSGPSHKASAVLQGPVSFSKGDRIAQLVLRKTFVFPVEECDAAPGGNRGGFGSTGK